MFVEVKKMHISDGLLDNSIILILWIIDVLFGAYSIYTIRKTNQENNEKPIIITGAITAMVFAFQMLNFPISAGTSGHLLGYMIMAIFMGPSYAFVMISTILVIQAFIFADGGILALGANIFNMGIVTYGAYCVFWIIRKKLAKNETTNTNSVPRSLILSGSIGAYLSLIIASFVCAIEIGLSANFPYGLELTIPVMMGYHAIIGIGEMLITAGILTFMYKYGKEFLPNWNVIPIWS